MLRAGTTGFRRRIRQGLILVSGICGIQAILYGPSLIGTKLLLPLDLVASNVQFLPATSSGIFADSVFHWEVARRYTASEFRAGRIPMWDPTSYAGAPYADFGKYSPFNLVRYLFPSPVAVAWVQLLKALVAGCSAYLFFKRVMRLRFWPATVAGSLYPLSGFFVLWLGDPISDVAVWYPALLVAIDAAIHRPGGWGGPAVAFVTCTAILCGHVDIAGQVLLGGGLFAVWSLIRRHGWRFSKPLAASAAVVTGGWLLGFMLSAPYLLPLLKYAESSQRFALRQSGKEERPPGRMANLAQVIYAEWFGTHRNNTLFYGTDPNLTESAAGAYTGVLTLLAVAPLAWTDRRRRGLVAFLSVSAVSGLPWVLGVGGAVDFLRLSGLNMMSHNRLTFLTAFAVMALAATGLNSIWRDGISRRSWFGLPLAVLILVSLLAVYRAFEPSLRVTELLSRFTNPDVERRRYFDTSICCAAFCAIGILSWCITCLGIRTRLLGRLLAVGMAVELISFAYGYNPQSDPALYYPPIPILEKVRQAEPGRVLGLSSPQPNLHQVYGLREVRGYDAIDPRWILDLLDVARHQSDQSPTYARAQLFRPRLGESDNGDLHVPPILDMLNVRYLILGAEMDTRQKPRFTGDQFVVYENRAALNRVFVPTRVEVSSHDRLTLRKMAEWTFDPRKVAFVSSSQALPSTCQGSAQIIDESPMQITVTAEMKTAGLLVLADQWAEGWECLVDGRPSQLLRTNHGLRGVVLPAGQHQALFVYHPPGLVAGLACMGLAIVTLIGWRIAATHGQFDHGS